MNASPSQTLAVGISTRALFDLSAEDEVLRAHGRDAYRRYQLERVEETLPPGPGLGLIRTLLRESSEAGRGLEVVIFSDGVADASLRVLSSARKHELEVGRAAFTGGDALAPYLRAFRVDLFLSTDEEEAGSALEAGTAAALVRAGAAADSPESPIRIAVEGRAVARALEGTEAEPARPAGEALPGVGAPRWVRALAGLQRAGGPERRGLRTALLCNEDVSTHGRILRALGDWDVALDQAFFTHGAAHDEVLAAFGPHIVFDVLRGRRVESPLDEARAEREETKRRAARAEAPTSSFSRLRLRS
jgi:5'-nucleotidase